MDDEYKDDNPANFIVDKAKLEREYKKFVKAIRNNYKKGIMKTRFYTDSDIMGEILKRVGTDLWNDLAKNGINKTPMYMYWYNWVEIELV